MKYINKILTALALAAALVLPASAEEMYYNRLSKGTEVIPAGTYGDIVVPEGGYCATKFGSSRANITEADGDFGGSYAKIIQHIGADTDIQTHTISGWFKQTKKDSTYALLFAPRSQNSTSSTNGHTGYKASMWSTGVLQVGKVKGNLTWNDTSGAHRSSTEALPNGEWFYFTLAITKTDGARNFKARAFVNGVELTMPDEVIAGNLNGMECIQILMGDNVSCAGLRVDDTAVTDPATMKAWATNERYVVQPPSKEISWTGAAGDGDPTNAANWEGGEFPDGETLVKLGGEVYLNAVAGKTFVCKDIAFTNDVTLANACDWSAMPVAPDTRGFALDLGGNGLVLSNVVVSGTVTNSRDDVATLTVNVAEGETVQNTSMSIQGNVQFVKDGAGTFVAGIKLEVPVAEIAAGTVRLTTEGFGDAAVVTVGGGATLDSNGIYDTKYALVLNDGATIANTGTGREYTKRQFDKGITLAEDATAYVNAENEMSFTAPGYGMYPINLNGGTLVKRGSAVLNFTNAQITNGTVRVVEGKIVLNAGNKGLSASDDVVFEASGEGIFSPSSAATIPTLAGNGHVNGPAALTVAKSLGGKVVLDTAVTLADGATLDLTGNDEPYETYANFTFGEGNITVDVSGREFEEGEQIVAWAAKPEGAWFRCDEATAQQGWTLSVGNSGIYVRSGETIATAHWTGAAGDYDIGNWENWACTNSTGKVVDYGVPNEATTVYFTGEDIKVQVGEGTEINWAAVSVDGKLGEDSDWSGLKATTIVDGSVLDLNGQELVTAGFTSGGIFAVTNSSEGVATFALNVPEETTCENSCVKLLGNLRLVKRGAGTFVGKVQDQTYTGGTVIEEGTINAANYEKFYCLGAAGTDITIQENGTLDSNGWYDWAAHRIVLNGGTLQNRGGNMTQEGWGGFGDILLTADSRMALSYHTSFNDNNKARYVDLGGHTLEIEYLDLPGKTDNKAILYALHTTWMNGTIEMGPNIMLRPYSYATFSNDLKIVCNGDLELTKADKTIGSLTDNSQGAHENYGYALTINGTYKPVSTNLHSTVMADGSTLDLTDQTGPWAFTCKEGKSQTLTFAVDATVAVDVSGWELEEGDKIIAWDAKPDASFKFAGYEGGLLAFAEADGLYARSTSTEVDKGYWTGAAGDGDPLNPANWACTNSAGQVVTEAVPTNATASVVIRNLATDLDWTKLGAVKFAAGEVDLAGHTLKVTAFAANSAAFVTNTVEALGTVKVDAGAGNSSSLGGSVICGNIALDVLSGTFQLTTSTGITGGNQNLITVASGATLDQNGVIDMPIRVRLEDNATLTNTGTARGRDSAQFTGGLELAENAMACIDTANQMALTAKDYATMPISIGNGTLVKKGTGKISIQNGAITGTGTIRVEAGELNLGYKGLAIDDTITVELQDNTEVSTYLWIEATCSIPRLAGNGRIAANSGNLTVTKYYSGLLQIGQQGGGNQFTKSTLTLGDGATLDLTEVEGAWTQHAKVAFGEDATITLDLTGRTVEAGEKVIAWTAMPPATTHFATKGADIYVVRKADGLYAARASMIFVR